MEVKRKRREKKQLEKVRVMNKPQRRKRKIKRKRRRVVVLASKTTQRFVCLEIGQPRASGSKMLSTQFQCLSSIPTETSLSARLWSIITTTIIIASVVRS